MITCRITAVAADSEFEGVTFTQIVTVELAGSQRLRLHDWMGLASITHVGKTVKLEVCVFEYESLAPVPARESPRVRQDASLPIGEVVGRIEAIDGGALRLHFGGGSVEIIPKDEDLKRLASEGPVVGSTVRVATARFDLTEIS